MGLRIPSSSVLLSTNELPCWKRFKKPSSFSLLFSAMANQVLPQSSQVGNDGWCLSPDFCSWHLLIRSPLPVQWGCCANEFWVLTMCFVSFPPSFVYVITARSMYWWCDINGINFNDVISNLICFCPADLPSCFLTLISLLPEIHWYSYWLILFKIPTLRFRTKPQAEATSCKRRRSTAQCIDFISNGVLFLTWACKIVNSTDDVMHK